MSDYRFSRTVYEFHGRTGPVRADKCLAITFFRPTTGTAPVNIGDWPLEAGQSLTINQPVGRLDLTDYQVVFGTPADGETNQLIVMKIMPEDVINA